MSFQNPQKIFITSISIGVITKKIKYFICYLLSSKLLSVACHHIYNCCFVGNAILIISVAILVASFLFQLAKALASLFFNPALTNLHLVDFIASVSHFATAAVAIAHVRSQKTTAQAHNQPHHTIFQVNHHCCGHCLFSVSVNTSSNLL